MNEIGNKPQTLKFTQNSSDWVLHIISFNIAKKKKKYIHLFVKIYQPSSFISNDEKGYLGFTHNSLFGGSNNIAASLFICTKY